MEFLYGVLVVFLVIVGIGIFIYTQYVVVETEEEWVVDRFGKDRVLKEGINRFVPYLDKKIAVINTREQRSDPPVQEIITKDNIKLEIDVLAWIKVVDSLKAINGVANYEESVKSAISAAVFNVMGGMELQEIQQNVEKITKLIREKAEEETIRWGVKITNIVIENMKQPESIVKAMEKEKAAEMEKRASILKAEGEHKVAELNADSERVLIEKRAEAIRNAIKNLKEEMPNVSDEKIMQFLTSTSYIDSMKELSNSENSKFILYPSDVKNPIDKIVSSEYVSQTMGKK